MAQKRSQDTSTTEIETTPERAPTPPPWFADALVVLRAVRVRALWPTLVERMRVERGRAGVYVAVDYLLVLLTFAVSDAPHLKALFAQLPPIASTLAAVWDRATLPSRAALSRFLEAARPHHVRAFGAMLLDDLIDAGIPAEQAGGLFDRDGRRTLVFDDDGTYHGARQRELADDATRPPPRRRARDLCARGYYGGSGRGDVTRTRTTLQQAHTQEWLGCWSAPGNGHPYAQIEDACLAVVRYLLARGLMVTQGLLRLDGLYGYARIAAAITRHGLGYLMRCADYRLFHRTVVQAVIAQAPHATYAAPDSPVRRDAWQVLDLPWVAAKDPADAVVTRLIITRRPAIEPGKPRVGKRVGDHVFELFVTDRSPSGWSIEDVLSLYFARGGFEATLAQEDRERDLDRTVSWSPAGQSLWTLVGQLAWNLRLRLGVRLMSTPVRYTHWASAAAQTPEPPAVPATVETPAIEIAVMDETPSVDEPSSSVVARGRVAAATGRSTGRFGGSDFVWTEEGHLRCPADKLLRRRETRHERCQLRVIYRASAADCGVCALSSKCRGRATRTDRGRRVSVIEPLSAGRTPTPSGVRPNRRSSPSTTRPALKTRTVPSSTSKVPPLGSHAVWWVDLPASQARQMLRDHLRGQHVDVGPSTLVLPRPATPFQTRDERAHRRQTWQVRFARNQRSLHDGCRLRIHGLPPVLDDLLGIPRDLPSAA